MSRLLTPPGPAAFRLDGGETATVSTGLPQTPPTRERPRARNPSNTRPDRPPKREARPRPISSRAP
ncbi:hypothetical protein SGPA1_20818 [Streptomyces misionensis JCM 4497]